MIDFLYDTFLKGGPILIVLFCISAYAWFLIINTYASLAVESREEKHYTSNGLALIKNNKLPELQDMLHADDRALSSNLVDVIQATKTELFEDTVMEKRIGFYHYLDRHMGTLATLAASAPLLGLLGTVTGIMKTFAVIKLFGSANPALMADGISEALITTQAGLVAAFPIVIVRSLLANKTKTVKDNYEKFITALGGIHVSISEKK